MADENSGIQIELKRDGFDSVIRSLMTEAGDLSAMGFNVATLLTESVRINIDQGGRPDKWPVSKRAQRDSGQTLVDTARLLNSIVGTFDGEAVRVGTGVQYAAAHHFGVDKEVEQQVRQHVRTIRQAFGKQLDSPKQVTVQAHSRRMHLQLPARPFMMIQDEDWEDVMDVVLMSIQGAAKAHG